MAEPFGNIAKRVQSARELILQELNSSEKSLIQKIKSGDKRLISAIDRREKELLKRAERIIEKSIEQSRRQLLIAAAAGALAAGLTLGGVVGWSLHRTEPVQISEGQTARSADGTIYIPADLIPNLKIKKGE